MAADAKGGLLWGNKIERELYFQLPNNLGPLRIPGVEPLIGMLESKIEFGSWKSMMEQKVEFCGRRYQQDGDFTVHVDMDEYIERLTSHKLPRERACRTSPSSSRRS